jgi:ribosomal protein S18 acetylase RimI-like enzyme
MPSKKIIIRKATIADSEPIATFLLLAMEDIFYQFIGKKDPVAAKNVMLHFVQQEQNQYSHQNCWVAELNGKVIAAINVYDGAKLVQLREPVAAFIRSYFNNNYNPEDETQAGEFYIDSLGVEPEWQGKGIGTKLLQFLIEMLVVQKGQTLGLLVEDGKPVAKILYLKLGFKAVGTKTLVGKQLEHLQISNIFIPN